MEMGINSKYVQLTKEVLSKSTIQYNNCNADTFGNIVFVSQHIAYNFELEI